MYFKEGMCFKKGMRFKNYDSLLAIVLLVVMGLFALPPFSDLALAETAAKGEKVELRWISAERKDGEEDKDADGEEAPKDGKGPMFTRFGALAINGMSFAVEITVGTVATINWRRQRDDYLTPARSEDIRRGAGVSPGTRLGLLEEEARAIVDRAEERRGADNPVRSVVRAIGRKRLNRTQWYVEPVAPIGGNIELSLNDTKITKVIPNAVKLPDYVKAALRNLSKEQVRVYINAINANQTLNSPVPFSLSKFIPKDVDGGKAHAYMRGIEQALLGERPGRDITKLGNQNPVRQAYELGQGEILNEDRQTRYNRFQIRLKHQTERVAIKHIPEPQAYADEIMRQVDRRVWAGYAGSRRPWFNSHRLGKTVGWIKGGGLIILPFTLAAVDGYTVWSTRRGVGRDAMGNFTSDEGFTEYDGENGVIFSDRFLIKNSRAGWLERILSDSPEADQEGVSAP